jgi:hypothetical protein
MVLAPFATLLMKSVLNSCTVDVTSARPPPFVPAVLLTNCTPVISADAPVA